MFNIKTRKQIFKKIAQESDDNSGDPVREIYESAIGKGYVTSAMSILQSDDPISAMQNLVVDENENNAKLFYAIMTEALQNRDLNVPREVIGQMERFWRDIVETRPGFKNLVQGVREEIQDEVLPQLEELRSKQEEGEEFAQKSSDQIYLSDKGLSAPKTEEQSQATKTTGVGTKPNPWIPGYWLGQANIMLKKAEAARNFFYFPFVIEIPGLAIIPEGNGFLTAARQRIDSKMKSYLTEPMYRPDTILYNMLGILYVLGSKKKDGPIFGAGDWSEFQKLSQGEVNYDADFDKFLNDLALDQLDKDTFKLILASVKRGDWAPVVQNQTAQFMETLRDPSIMGGSPASTNNSPMPKLDLFLSKIQAMNKKPKTVKMMQQAIQKLTVQPEKDLWGLNKAVRDQMLDGLLKHTDTLSAETDQQAIDSIKLYVKSNFPNGEEFAKALFEGSFG